MNKINLLTLLACVLLTAACGSDTVEGDPNYLAKGMLTLEQADGSRMFFLDHGDGTVSLTYDRRNPMHVSASNTSVLTDYVGEVEIPANFTLDGKSYTVRAITDNAFTNNTTLTKVIIPQSVKSIGRMAFYNCPLLEEVGLPEGLEEIADNCFYGCKALSQIQIPQSVRSIGRGAFMSCAKIEALTVPEGVTQLPTNCFSGCSSLRSIQLPQSMETIAQFAFASCSKLPSVVIPEKVVQLPDSVFYNCSGLVTVVLPESMTRLGKGTFAGCKGMVEMTIPVALTEIGDSCFCSVDSKTGLSNWKRLTLNVKSTVPPVLTGSISNATDRKRIVVPRGYREVYEQDRYWGEFKEIMERNY